MFLFLKEEASLVSFSLVFVNGLCLTCLPPPREQGHHRSGAGRQARRRALRAGGQRDRLAQPQPEAQRPNALTLDSLLHGSDPPGPTAHSQVRRPHWPVEGCFSSSPACACWSCLFVPPFSSSVGTCLLGRVPLGAGGSWDLCCSVRVCRTMSAVCRGCFPDRPQEEGR